MAAPCGRHWTKGLVLRSNVELHLADGAKSASVPEHPGAYPESNMFRPNRILPAYGLYIRHADGVVKDGAEVSTP